MCTGECTLRASLDLAEGDVVDEDVLVVVRTGSLDGPGGWIAVTSIGELCEAANTQSTLGFSVTYGQLDVTDLGVHGELIFISVLAIG